MKKFSLDTITILDEADEKFKTITIPVFLLNPLCPCDDSLLFGGDFRFEKAGQFGPDNF